MSEKPTTVKGLMDGVFAAEENAAANLGESRLNKYSGIAVRMFHTGVHIIPTFIHIIPYFFYDLVGEKREKMYIALNERRALLAKEDQFSELEELVNAIESET